MRTHTPSSLRSKRGATAIEYVLMASMSGLMLIASIVAYQSAMSTSYQSIHSAVDEGISSPE